MRCGDSVEEDQGARPQQHGARNFLLWVSAINVRYSAESGHRLTLPSCLLCAIADIVNRLLAEEFSHAQFGAQSPNQALHIGRRGHPRRLPG